MSTLTYTGSYSGTDGLNAVRVVQLSASGQIANYRIDGLTAHIFLSTNAYGKTYSVSVEARNSSGTAIASGSGSVKLNSSNYTGAWVDIGLSALSGFDPNAIASMAIWDTTANSRSIFLKGNTMSFDVSYTQYSWCSPPSVVSAPAQGAPGGSIEVTWSGAAAGANMWIASYTVYRSTSPDSGFVPIAYNIYTQSYTDSNLPANVTLYYKVQSIASVAGYDSGLSASSAGTAVYYGWCTPPTVVSAPALATPASGVTISWSGATSGQNVWIAGYHVHRCETIDGTYDLIGVSHSESYTDTAVTGGHTYYYKIQTIANVSEYSSGYSNPTNGTKVNALPSAPTIVSTGTIYNPRPRILIIAGSDADGDQLTIVASGYTASTNPVQSGARVILRKSADTSGVQTIGIVNTDPNGGSAGANGSITVGSVAWTDDPIVAGTTTIKAVHINELRAALDTVCDYYGISRTAWSEQIVARVTPDINWPAHIMELRQTIQRIADYVNSWDTASTTHRIVLPSMKTPTRPSAEIMNQLREIIKLL